METIKQYYQFLKPSWSPPDWLFGPVWSVLYIIIFISFGKVFYSALNKEITWIIALPFVLNLIFNFAFTPIQFGLRSNLLASVDILLILVTLVWALYSIWVSAPGLRWVAYANIPYLCWVIFATALQLSITYLNRG